MRGVVEGLENPHPLYYTLPALYQEPDMGGVHAESFTQRFTQGFDLVVAPLFLAIDNLDAYFDPKLTPEDFLEWLAGWVGVELDERWAADRRRTIIDWTVEMYRWRGTKKGISMAVEYLTGITPEVEESGGTNWSHEPMGPLPGSPRASVTVRVPADPDTIDVPRLQSFVAASVPGNVIAHVEVSAP